MAGFTMQVQSAIFQAGHGKIVVGSGQDTENPILCVADYTSALCP